MVLVCFFSWMPMMSTCSPVRTMPRSIRPVTTVPRPVIVNTSSIGIRNGLSVSRSGCGMYSSTASISSRMLSLHLGSPFIAGKAATRTIGQLSPSNS